MDQNIHRIRFAHAKSIAHCLLKTPGNKSRGVPAIITPNSYHIGALKRSSFII
jgi:hypothetical protein